MTFEVIVTTFLESRGLALDAVPLTDGADEQVTPEVTNHALIEAFRQWHARVARLDFVKDTINLAQSSRLRLKPGRYKSRVSPAPTRLQIYKPMLVTIALPTNKVSIRGSALASPRQ